VTTATFFIGGKFFGIGNVGYGYNRRAGHYAPESLAYFCPTCGEIWARIAVADAIWQTYRAYCEQHPAPWYMPAGSIILPWVEEMAITFPEEVLKREILIYGKELEDARS
jgi:hypothetical protein